MKFFAEGLPRLSVVNLDLQSESSLNGCSLSTVEGDHHAYLRHGDEVISIPLPLAASSTKTFTYSDKSSMVTTRISAIGSKSSNESQSLLSESDLQEQSRVLCASCRRQVLKSKPMRWKELPSESWVEFSDYWLCHPGHSHSLSHSHSHHIHKTESHAINPIPILKPTPGISLLGLTFVLVDPSDTQNITIKTSHVLCECGERLGRVVDRGLQLDFWKLEIGAEKSFRLNAVECLVCYMFHHIAQSATYKFLLLPETGNALWIFSTDAIVTYSDSASSQRVIKVMFREVSEETKDIEVVRLEADAVSQVKSELHRIRSQMIGITQMGEWSIGYLLKI